MPSPTDSVRTTSPAGSARVIAVVNQKGGVGKTTTAMNLAASLALEGFSTLLIDCDPQANATSGLGIAKGGDQVSVYDLLLGDTPAGEGVVATAIPNLSLIPGTRNLIGANLELVEVEHRERRLRVAIEPLRSQFAFLLLDCPPALDLLTLNALVAAHRLLVPMQAEYFALEGISELMATLDRISATFNPELGLEGVLLTMFDERTNLSQQVRDNLQAFFGEKLYETTIPRNVKLAEAPSHGQPAVTYDPRSRGAEAYRQLARELLRRNGVPLPAENDRKNAESTPDAPGFPPVARPERRRKSLILDEIPKAETSPDANESSRRRLWPFHRVGSSSRLA